MNDKLVDILAAKLGVNSHKVLSKSTELLRLTEIRAASPGVGGLNIPCTCKAIICIELAALLTKTPIDKNLALKLSGTRKRFYQNALQMLERVLELDTSLITVKDMGVQFGCMQAVSLAESVLERYQEELKSRYSQICQQDIDFTKPMYAVAAFSSACRQLKIKVERQKLQELGRVSSSVFHNLCLEMDKITAEIIAMNPSIVKAKRDKSLVEMVEDIVQEDNMASCKKMKTGGDKDNKLSYIEWKQKILESTADIAD